MLLKENIDILIVETTRSLLLSAYVPSEFWREAVLAIVTLINTIPSSHISGISHFGKLYEYALDYSFFRVFGCTCFVLKPHVERSKLSSRSIISVFLSYSEGQKGYRCFDPTTQKLYVSRHVVFLKHISFFSIPTSIHDLTRSDLLHIDPFFEDCSNLSSQVSSTSYTPSHVLPPSPLHHIQRVITNSSTGTGTLLCGTPEAPSSPMVPQAPSKIADPPLRRSTCVCKSTKSLGFAYSCYSSSFTSFLASIHCFSKPSSYKEAILDPLW